MLRLLIQTMLLLSLMASVPSSARSAPDEKYLVITHISVVDVKAGRLIPDQNVLLSGERIVSILPARTAKIPHGATIIKGNGRFLMPGLFDCHVHLNNPDRETRMLVASGVTFVRDMGGSMGERIAQRQQARRGDFHGLEVACVGTILDGDPPYHSWSRACGTPEEGRRAVQELKKAGVDQIKVYSLLKPNVHRAICEEAKRMGLKVVGHITDSMTLEAAISDGQQGVEHLSRYSSLLEALLPGFQPVPAEFDGGIWQRYPDVDKAQLHLRLKRLAAAGTVVCPTLVLHAGQARILDPTTKALWNQYALPDDRRDWNEIPARYAAYGKSQAAAFSYLQQTLVELSQAHVPLLVGTDLANPGILAGFSVHTEMQLWQAAGLQPVDVLRAATLVPARFLGVDARLGTVETGKTASLVLIRTNPLQEIRNAADIEAVFVRGRYFDRAALDRLLTDAREDVLTRSPAPIRTERLELPGVVVARGRYNLFFEQYGDGTEDFLITKVGEVYHYKAMRVQRGFGRYPTLQTGQWTANFTPLQGESEPSVLLPTVEQYGVKQNLLYHDAIRSGKSLGKTQSIFPNDTALRSPFLSADFFLFHLLRLNVGQTKRVETFLLGRQDWKPQRQQVNVERWADESAEASVRQTPLCQHYSMTVVGNDDVRSDVWLNAQGVPVKQVTTQGLQKRSAVLDPN